MLYYVDGYNFLFRLRRLSGTLEKQRSLLLKHFAETVDSMNLDITVVFDSGQEADDSSRHHFRNVEVVYAHRGQTADDYIVEMVGYRHKGKVTVVTSDRALTSHCRSLGAATMTTEDFLSFIGRRCSNKKKVSSKTSHAPTLVSDAMMRRYEKIFQERYGELIKEFPSHERHRKFP